MKIEVKEFTGNDVENLNKQIDKYFCFGPIEILDTNYMDMGCVVKVVFVYSYIDMP